MTILPMHVLQLTYENLCRTADGREGYICSLFASYFGDRGSKSTAHRYMTYPNTIPRSLIRHYADPMHPHCPPMLRYDILWLLKNTYPLADSNRIQLWNVLLDILYALPAEDQQMMQIDTIVYIPTSEQVSHLFAQILWYTICQ